jgi:hypothetical protein
VGSDVLRSLCSLSLSSSPRASVVSVAFFYLCFSTLFNMGANFRVTWHRLNIVREGRLRLADGRRPQFSSLEFGGKMRSAF